MKRQLLQMLSLALSSSMRFSFCRSLSRPLSLSLCLALPVFFSQLLQRFKSLRRRLRAAQTVDGVRSERLANVALLSISGFVAVIPTYHPVHPHLNPPSLPRPIARKHMRCMPVRVCVCARMCVHCFRRGSLKSNVRNRATSCNYARFVRVLITILVDTHIIFFCFCFFFIVFVEFSSVSSVDWAAFPHYETEKCFTKKKNTHKRKAKARNIIDTATKITTASAIKIYNKMQINYKT